MVIKEKIVIEGPAGYNGMLVRRGETLKVLTMSNKKKRKSKAEKIKEIENRDWRCRGTVKNGTLCDKPAKIRLLDLDNPEEGFKIWSCDKHHKEMLRKINAK